MKMIKKIGTVLFSAALILSLAGCSAAREAGLEKELQEAKNAAERAMEDLREAAEDSEELQKGLEEYDKLMDAVTSAAKDALK